MDKLEKRLKQTVKIIGASTPLSAVLTQWLNEIEQEALEEKVQTLEKKLDHKIEHIENPILNSHKHAGKLLKFLSKKIANFGGTSFDFGFDFKPFAEVLFLWKSEGLIGGRDAVGRGPTSP